MFTVGSMHSRWSFLLSDSLNTGDETTMSAKNKPRVHIFFMKIPIKGRGVTWALVIGVSSAYILQRGEKNKPQALPVPKVVAKPRKAKSYADALVISEETGRPIVLVFKMSNCGWCRKFKETLKDSKVKEVLSEYVFLEVVGEKNPVLCDRYGINSYPAYRLVEVLDGKERVLKKGTGYKDPDAFIAWIILEHRGKS